MKDPSERRGVLDADNSPELARTLFGSDEVVALGVLDQFGKPTPGYEALQNPTTNDPR